MHRRRCGTVRSRTPGEICLTLRAIAAHPNRGLGVRLTEGFTSADL
jgi:hypothetical protein